MPAVVVGEVGGGPGRRDCDVDLQVEPGAILGDLDESVQVTGRYGQFLEIVRVLVDVTGALEIRAGLKLGEGLVLFVLLDKPEPELGLELGPGGEREWYGGCTPFCPSGSRVLRHEGHGKLDEFFLRDEPVRHESFWNQPVIGEDGVKEHPSLHPVTVKNGRGVRSKDRFWSWVGGREIWTRRQSRNGRGGGRRRILGVQQ
jgi:hypothetical protein